MKSIMYTSFILFIALTIIPQNSTAQPADDRAVMTLDEFKAAPDQVRQEVLQNPDGYIVVQEGHKVNVWDSQEQPSADPTKQPVEQQSVEQQPIEQQATRTVVENEENLDHSGWIALPVAPKEEVRPNAKGQDVPTRQQAPAMTTEEEREMRMKEEAQDLEQMKREEAEQAELMMQEQEREAELTKERRVRKLERRANARETQKKTIDAKKQVSPSDQAPLKKRD